MPRSTRPAMRRHTQPFINKPAACISHPPRPAPASPDPPCSPRSRHGLQTQQTGNIHMLHRLRLYPFISRHHQQYGINAQSPRQSSSAQNVHAPACRSDRCSPQVARTQPRDNPGQWKCRVPSPPSAGRYLRQSARATSSRLAMVDMADHAGHKRFFTALARPAIAAASSGNSVHRPPSAYRAAACLR